MKKSKHNQVHTYNDIRLYKLYTAIKSPRSSANAHYITQLNTVPVSTIDSLLCKIQSQYQKIQQQSENNEAQSIWPLHRLLEIFNTILLCMQHRPQQDDLLRLLSFKANVRMVLQSLVYDEEDLDGDNNMTIDDPSFIANKVKASKCWCTLLEHLSAITKQDLSKGTVKAIINDIKLKHAHIHALLWATSVTQKDMSPFIQHSTADISLILARNYCLRGLIAHASLFGKDLIEHQVYQRLLLHSLTYYFGNNYQHFSSMDPFSSPSLFSEANQKQQLKQQQGNDDGRHLLTFCNTATQLLDNLIKLEKDIGIHSDHKDAWEQYIKVSSVNTLSFIKVWVGSLFLMIKNGIIIKSQSMKEVSQIFYYLTVIVSKTSTDTGVFAYLVPNFSQQQLNNSNSSASECLWAWHRIFPLLLSQLIYRLQIAPSSQQQQENNIKNNNNKDDNNNNSSSSFKKTNSLISPYNTPLLVRLLVSICTIFWKCQHHINKHTNLSLLKENDVSNNRHTISELITGYITNFLLAFTAHPIPVEMIVVMACNNNNDINNDYISILPMTLTADVVIRGYYRLTSECIETHYSLLTPLLETLIQYTPLIQKSWRLTIGPKLAWSIKSLLSLLDADNKLDDSPLLSRIEKLIIYLLHDDNAIDQLADCTNGLDKYIWAPTIQQARNGLFMATSTINDIQYSSSLIDDNNNHSYKNNIQSLEKGKRALMALEKISSHSRACERLADTDILNLIDSVLLSGHPFRQEQFTVDQTALLVRSWTVYALFTRLLASLAGRTSLLRSKLRQENRLVPSIMSLLWYTHQFECILFLNQSSYIDLSMVCQFVVNGCLQVINAYKYDQQAIQEWMDWNNSIGEQDNITLITILLCIVIPWRNRTTENINIGQWWTLFDNQICMASMILENLAQYTECGEQLIESNGDALRDIPHWMVSITYALNNFMTLDNSNNSNSSDLVNDQMDDKLQYEYGINDDQHLFYCENNSNENINSPTPVTATMPLFIEEEETINASMSSRVILESEKNKSANKKQPVSLKEHCLLPLSRCLTKIITHRGNLKSLIMHDGFTQLFGPFLLNIKNGVNNNNKTWLTVIQQFCQSLFLRIEDLERLIRFYDQNDQDIKRRHELTAIAMAYATCWNQDYWQSKLSLLHYDTKKESIVYSTGPFGIICHMLTMKFDDNNNNNNNNINNSVDGTAILEIKDNNNNNNNKESVTTKPSNFQQRRNTAAQALTMLIIPYQDIWKSKLYDDISTHQTKLNQELLLKQNTPMIQLKKKTSILLRTDDTMDPIKAQYIDLTWLSPAFTAMLSNDYAETDYIHLHDISMTSLKHYIHVSQQLYHHQQQLQQSQSQQQLGVILQSWRWEDIIELIQVADRYGGRAIHLLCELWILEQIKYQQKDYLSGCLKVYLNLRNKYQHDDGGGLLCTTWPYRVILCQCIKAMISNLLGLTHTNSFQQFINSDNNNNNDNDNIENIEDFCNAIYIFFHNPLL
ncbi:hypothetical protein BJ944DRAFT_250263 [Cunninghamella echinulata]|nr:hypothetical protein BJ944DRAFT_250263 [Cunninghamella echinulata]